MGHDECDYVTGVWDLMTTVWDLMTGEWVLVQEKAPMAMPSLPGLPGGNCICKYTIPINTLPGAPTDNCDASPEDGGGGGGGYVGGLYLNGAQWDWESLSSFPVEHLSKIL